MTDRDLIGGTRPLLDEAGQIVAIMALSKKTAAISESANRKPRIR